MKLCLVSQFFRGLGTRVGEPQLEMSMKTRTIVGLCLQTWGRLPVETRLGVTLTLPPHRINTSGGEQLRSDSPGLQLHDRKGAAPGRKEASSPCGKRAAPRSPLLQRRLGISEGTAGAILKTWHPSACPAQTPASR